MKQSFESDVYLINQTSIARTAQLLHYINLTCCSPSCLEDSQGESKAVPRHDSGSDLSASFDSELFWGRLFGIRVLVHRTN